MARIDYKKIFSKAGNALVSYRKNTKQEQTELDTLIKSGNYSKEYIEGKKKALTISENAYMDIMRDEIAEARQELQAELDKTFSLTKNPIDSNLVNALNAGFTLTKDDFADLMAEYSSPVAQRLIADNARKHGFEVKGIKTKADIMADFDNFADGLSRSNNQNPLQNRFLNDVAVIGEVERLANALTSQYFEVFESADISTSEGFAKAISNDLNFEKHSKESESNTTEAEIKGSIFKASLMGDTAEVEKHKANLEQYETAKADKARADFEGYAEAETRRKEEKNKPKQEQEKPKASELDEIAKRIDEARERKERAEEKLAEIQANKS